MQVFVNGQPREVPEAASLLQLLADLKLGRRALAVEINREVVPREAHASTRLAEGDRVEIVTLVGGG
jgi:sulfur carrier protein